MEQRFSQWPEVGVELVERDGGACAYLAGRESRVLAFWGEGLTGEGYQRAMDTRFRRSGRVVYQPVCKGCRECVPLRVEVGAFRASKSQRRCWRRNGDLRVAVGAAAPTWEKWEMYQRYQREWHGKVEVEDPTDYVSFLYDSPVETVEFTYRDGAGKLVGAGICDVTPAAVSSVYFYFDPGESRRGVGTYSAMVEMEWAKAEGKRWWYAGYWVRGCGAMAYKGAFRPFEVLGEDGAWRRSEEF